MEESLSELRTGFTAVCELMTFTPTKEHYMKFMENPRIPMSAEITVQSNGMGYYLEATWDE